MVKRNPLPQNLKEKIKPEDVLIENMALSWEWCFHAVVENVTDLSLKQMNNNFEWITKKKDEWRSGEVDTGEIIDIAKNQRPYLWETIKTIPYSTMLKMAGIGNGKKKSTVSPYMKEFLQVVCCIVFVSVDTVFKDHRHYSEEERKLFFSHMAQAADLMAKGYLTSKGINEQFKNRLHYDLTKGEKVG